MELSTAGLDLIKRSGGFRNKTYLDIAGHPTIGYGHRLEHNECYPSGICETEASVILLWEVREAEQAVSRLVLVELTQGQLDALVDFTFQPRLEPPRRLNPASCPECGQIRRCCSRNPAPGSRRRAGSRSPQSPPRSRIPPLDRQGSTTASGSLDR